MSPSANSRRARSMALLRKGRSGPSASTSVRCSAACVGQQHRPRLAHARRSSSLSSSTRTWPFLTGSPYSTRISLTMPLAFDFTSTFDSGSILPVATTERAMSPFSMAASFDESISSCPREAETSPTTPSRTTPAIPASSRRRRDFFLPFPFPVIRSTSPFTPSNAHARGRFPKVPLPSNRLYDRADEGPRQSAASPETAPGRRGLPPG